MGARAPVASLGTATELYSYKVSLAACSTQAWLIFVVLRRLDADDCVTCTHRAKSLSRVVSKSRGNVGDGSDCKANDVTCSESLAHIDTNRALPRILL